jgi:hypothetical protein
MPDHTEPLLGRGEALLAAEAAKAAAGALRLLSFNAEFLGAAEPGAMISGTAKVARATRSAIFVTGTLSCAGRPIVTLAGIYQVQM